MNPGNTSYYDCCYRYLPICLHRARMFPHTKRQKPFVVLAIPNHNAWAWCPIVNVTHANKQQQKRQKAKNTIMNIPINYLFTPVGDIGRRHCKLVLVYIGKAHQKSAVILFENAIFSIHQPTKRVHFALGFVNGFSMGES